MLNRRNAALGWFVWQLGKRMAKRKARAVALSAEPFGVAVIGRRSLPAPAATPRPGLAACFQRRPPRPSGARAA